MSFADFVAQMRDHGEHSKMLYFQQALVMGVGEQILRDFQQLDLETAVLLKQLGHWQELTTNLLLVAPRGAVTPAHFDEQQNLFAQICGRKHVRLFRPQEFARMYPFPLAHPGDRQSQLEIPAVAEGGPRLPPANAERFPGFSRTVEYSATLSEGEVLYIPAYWWHQIESLTDNVSMTWWFKCAAADQAEKDSETGRIRLREHDKAALRRNVERLLGQLVGARVAAADRETPREAARDRESTEKEHTDRGRERQREAERAHAFFHALEMADVISPEDFRPEAGTETEREAEGGRERRLGVPEEWSAAISSVAKMLQVCKISTYMYTYRTCMLYGVGTTSCDWFVVESKMAGRTALYSLCSTARRLCHSCTSSLHDVLRTSISRETQKETVRRPCRETCASE